MQDKLTPALRSHSDDVASANLTALLTACFCRYEIPSLHHGYDILRFVRNHKADIPTQALATAAQNLITTVTNETRPEMFWHCWLIDLACASMYILDSLHGKDTHAAVRTRLVAFARTMLVEAKNTTIFLRFAFGVFADEELCDIMTSLFLDAYIGG